MISALCAWDGSAGFHIKSTVSPQGPVSSRLDPSWADLIARLRAAGDPLHLLAADALTAWSAELETLRARALQLEAVARLNGETIRSMQEAAREQEISFHRRRPRLPLPAKGA